MSVTQADAISIGPPTSAGHDLVSSTVHYFRHYDVEGLACELREHWTTEELVLLLASDRDDTVKVAAACLGVVGTFRDCAALARTLNHDDALVVSMAEHALWLIWLRHPDADIRRDLHVAVRLIDHNRERHAVERLSEVIARAPDFAEAYNQRAIAYCFIDRPLEAIADYKRTIRLNPHHFAALAGMGHCLVQLNRFHEALQAYRAALNIHPRMDGVRQSIRQLSSILNRVGTPGH
ncbi:MAG TPA: tetratricopeptide repeat protein [Phycisphaerae bacterium]|nr:tetratricopeptide repeat protein [Phycisphaerae bacterium]